MSVASVYIPLTRGRVAAIDWEDRERVSGFKWRTKEGGKGLFYAVSNFYRGGKRTTIHMHNLLLPNAPRVDHRDGDGLNNRRENLREKTHRQNLQSFQRKREGTSSRFRGVTKWAGSRWVARIKVRPVNYYLGTFADEESAARAYDVAALKLGFEKEALNFPT